MRHLGNRPRECRNQSRDVARAPRELRRVRRAPRSIIAGPSRASTPPGGDTQRASKLARKAAPQKARRILGDARPHRGGGARARSALGGDRLGPPSAPGPPAAAGQGAIGDGAAIHPRRRPAAASAEAACCSAAHGHVVGRGGSAVERHVALHSARRCQGRGQRHLFRAWLGLPTCTQRQLQLCFGCRSAGAVPGGVAGQRREGGGAAHLPRHGPAGSGAVQRAQPGRRHRRPLRRSTGGGGARDQHRLRACR